MLTGLRPFVGDNIGALVYGIATTRFTPPEEINPGVPRAAGNIVRRCLKKDPDGRYVSVDSLLRDVRSAMGDKVQDLPTMVRTFAFNSVDNEEIKTQTSIHRQPEREQAAVRPSDPPSQRVTTKRSGFPMTIVAGVVVIILLLIAGAGIVGIWALSGKPETVKLAEPPANPPANKDPFGGGRPDRSPGTKSDATPDTKTVAKPNNGEVKPQTTGEARKIRIDLDEGKAQVLRNGSVLGTTPLDIDLAAGETPTLTLHRDGFEDKEVRIEAGGGKRAFTFSLRPKK
jgi:serine/threonine protein kinase